MSPAIVIAAAQAAAAPSAGAAIVITASRYPQPVAETLADVQAIGREEIENSGKQSLAAFLASQPGVNLIQTGGEGAGASVALRGTSSGQTLVLVNGVRVSSATTGAASINDLSLGLVRRIEIVRGPRSVQYGSDAVGGVINIITAASSATPGLHGSLSATAGNHDSYGAQAALQYGGASLAADATVGFLRTAGTNATRPTAFNYDPDKDGYRSLFAAGNLRSGPLFASAQFNDFRLDFDPFPGGSDVERARVYSISAGLQEARVGSALRLNLPVFFAADERREIYRQGFLAGSADTFNTHRYGASPNLRADYRLLGAKATTLIGGDWYRDEVSGNTPYTRNRRDVRAVYAQQDVDTGLLLGSFGIRYEDNEQFGSVTTWQAAGGVRLGERLVARASYATSFRAPTFNDLYYPGFSNPDLTPERGRNAEAGLTYSGLALSASATVFRNRIRDQIAYDPARFNVFNVQRVGIEGFDVRAAARIRRFELFAGAEYARPRNVLIGRDLLYRPRWTASGGVTFHLTNALTASANLSYVGRRFTDPQNMTKLSGWTLLGASVSWQPLKRLSLQLAADNLLDTDYEPMPGYYGARRSVRATATLSF